MYSFLGTSMVCAFLEVAMAFMPVRILQRIFPPMVTGTVILLIGASLIGKSGMANWGGGSNDCQYRPETGIFTLCPTINAPKPLLYVFTLRSTFSLSRLTTPLQMGIPRIHRSRFPLLHLHRPHRALWLSIPEEHLYHRRPCRGLYRCRRCWLH